MDNNIIALIITVGASTLVTMGSMIGMFLWSRSEASTDRREVHAILRGIADEMKDFHSRLCIIEERNKGK